VKALRAVLSVMLVLVGAATLATGSVLLWTDGHVFDTEQVSTTTQDVLADPKVQGLLTREVTDRVMEYVPDQTQRPQITTLVENYVASESALTLIDQGIRTTHRQFVKGTDPTVQLNLTSLATEVRLQLVAAAPELANTLPAPDAWFNFQLLERKELPQTYKWVERFHSSALALIIFGVCLVGLALVLGPARWALLSVTGVGIAGFGFVLVFALRRALKAGEARVTDPVARAASKNIFDIFFKDLGKQSVTLIVVGGVLALLGVSIGLIRPEYMREKDPWAPERDRRHRR
jgi:hypothetical protein